MFRKLFRRLCFGLSCALVVAVVAAMLEPTAAVAQQNPPAVVRDTVIVSSGFDRHVGGVSVNVDGVLNNVDPRGRAS